MHWLEGGERKRVPRIPFSFDKTVSIRARPCRSLLELDEEPGTLKLDAGQWSLQDEIYSGLSSAPLSLSQHQALANNGSGAPRIATHHSAKCKGFRRKRTRGWR
jgi:hypothetical protein